MSTIKANAVEPTTTNSDLTLSGNGTGVVALDTLKASTTNTDLNLSANGTGGIVIGTGFGCSQQTVYDLGTNSSGTETLDSDNGNFQKGINGGAHTLAPQSQLSTIVVQYTNNASAGTLSTSGFDIVTGDTISTTNGDDFMLYSTVNGAFQHLHAVALQ